MYHFYSKTKNFIKQNQSLGDNIMEIQIFVQKNNKGNNLNGAIIGFIIFQRKISENDIVNPGRKISHIHC